MPLFLTIAIDAGQFEYLSACNQLNSSNGTAPNTVVDVLALVPPNNTWHLIAQTEIVEKSQNPLFLKTIGLGDNTTPLQTRIKLLIYDVKELETGIVSIKIRIILSNKLLSHESV